MNAGAVIVAGGTGKRMNAAMPKQLLELEGRTILEWTLDPFLNCDPVREIVIASVPAAYDTIINICAIIQKTATKTLSVVHGGSERQDSVRNGLAALGGDCDIVVIHDAVRPFVTPQEITACTQAAEQYEAASLMRPVRETVKIVREGFVEDTIDRSLIWITQTPQAFRRTLLADAHERALRDGFSATDDCMLVERLGVRVRAVEGSDYNMKITTPADLVIAKTVLPVFLETRKQC
jgi:2-C-methyl-D-erythritol 4-phosphate cytidylyltransferase